jgi:2-polyprenyl-3-methyl-5-hydroxy-6-metoxy-1,4-benzoquinol methylase
MKTGNDFAVERIRELVSKELRGPLLDIGPGLGMNARMLASMGFDVHVCDYSQDLLDRLEFKGKKSDLNKNRLPYTDEYFQVVVCTEIIEHLENPWHLIREAKRVLKKGGSIIISTPYLDSLLQRIRFFALGNFFKFPEDQKIGEHINPIHAFEMRNLLKQNGMTIEKITFNRSFVPIIRLSFKPNPFFGELVMLRARK